jgi:hypothetical protein
MEADPSLQNLALKKILAVNNSKELKCRRPEVNLDRRSVGGHVSSDQAFWEFDFGGLCNMCIEKSQRAKARSPKCINLEVNLDH